MDNNQEDQNISENIPRSSSGSNFGLYMIMVISVVIMVGIIASSYIQHH